MSTGTLLQLLLFLQIFVMGVLASMGWRHYSAHRSSQTQSEPERKSQQPQVAVELPKELKERLLQTSQSQFIAAVNNAAAQLQSELGATNSQINDLVMRLATDVVSSELSHYKEELDRLKKQTEADMSGIRTEVAKHEEELKAKLAQEIEGEKQKLIKQIDTKLADAVGSFLTETLQHNVDLGTQSAYLVQMLEEHKQDFIKEVGNEDQIAG